MADRKLNDDLSLRFSVSEKHLGKVTNVQQTWQKLRLRLTENIIPDRLTWKQFTELKQDRQAELKNVGYFVGGQFKGGARQKEFIDKRQIVTLDIDQGTPDIVKSLQTGVAFNVPFEYVAHSTRTHNGKDKIKLHVVIPLAKPVDLDTWFALTRILAYQLDPTMMAVDHVSYLPAQVMYWPSTCADVKPITIHHSAPLLDVDAALDTCPGGDWRDIKTLPHSPREGELRDPSKKAEDPTEKAGWVGAFCRTHDVHSAIETFGLPYTISDRDGHNTPTRYTYTDGQGANGAAVYDDGKKLHSNHGSDPALGQNNSFDLTRIHLFGKLDPPGEAEKPPSRWKSFQALVELLREKHPDVCLELTKSNLMPDEDALADAFESDDAVAGPEKALDVPTAPPATALAGHARDALSVPEGPRHDPDWIGKLATTAEGALKSNLPNLVLILTHAGRFRDRIAFDEMAQRIVLLKPIGSKILDISTRKGTSPYMSDESRAVIRCILESPRGPKLPGFGLNITDRNLEAALMTVASRRPFNHVTSWLLALPGWDETPRLRQLFTMTCGTPDDEYHRQVSHHIMVAAVARAFEPGCKFDFLPILEGKQGIGKSRFVRALAPYPALAGETEGHFDDPKRFVESTSGKLILEIPELNTFNKAAVTAIKKMLSSRCEQVRLAYRHDEAMFPRRCVMIGTTNETNYLRDDTGNRRMWPVKCTKTIDLKWLAENHDQIWAEALDRYRVLALDRADQDDDLPLYLTGEADTASVVHQEERMVVDVAHDHAGMISVFLETPVPASRAKSGADQGADVSGESLDGPLVLRNVTCGQELFDHALHINGTYDQRWAQSIGKAMKHVPGWIAAPKLHCGKYGQPRTYRRIETEGDTL